MSSDSSTEAGRMRMHSKAARNNSRRDVSGREHRLEELWRVFATHARAVTPNQDNKQVEILHGDMT